jgi:protein O-mannosyl-transferase
MSDAFARLARYPWLLIVLLSGCVLAAYGNHFHNSFHFDDSHTIVDNPSIRSLRNFPRFFTDSRTFSVLPSNRSWRPLVTASLAIDYRMGGGLDPFWFQLSTFVWYLVLVALLYLFFSQLLDGAFPALLAAALFGLHPVCAETVNYINQRAEVYSTLGVVAGLHLYAVRPAWRRSLLYLAPVALALLSKPPALVFPALLFLYVFLFENRSAIRSLWAALPALALSAIFGVLQVVMTPPTYLPGAASAYAYRITQPYVALRYFESFFLPVRLSADTDLQPLRSALTSEALVGLGFVSAVILAAWFCSRRQELKPAAFGLWWFLIALAPTSLFPLAEVENDHRMFFPFVGLSLSAGWTLGLVWKYFGTRAPRWAALVCAAGLLAACGYGVHARNQVWHDDVSLWHDVTVKSPTNGRGWMNYGTALMAKGDLNGALDCFDRALRYSPNYDLVEVNLGIVTGALHRDAEAEQHFARALSLAPQDAAPHYYYGRWLRDRGQPADALEQVNTALLLNADQPGARELLQGLKNDQASPTAATQYLQSRTPEQWLELSLMYYDARQYEKAVAAAQSAIFLRPAYAEAYNNVGAAYAALQSWDLAIEADRQAIQLKPDYQLARGNLAWALDQQRLHSHR